jgi:hypothetical protein
MIDSVQQAPQVPSMKTRSKTICAQTIRLVALLCGIAASGAGLAETLVVNDQLTVPAASVQTPPRGSTMTEVEKHFGAPVEKHATVGQPPITRWDYNGFAVFFEHDRVIHAVATSG